MGSHSTGISVSSDLTHSFAEAHQKGTKRLIKVQIVDDVLAETGSDRPSGDFLSDLDKVPRFLDANAPSYILVRTDDRSQSGYNWVFMCYVPDFAKVKEKMVYAGSRANLKLGIGASNFVDDIFGTVPEDFDKKGYLAWKEHQQQDAPLTASEQQLKEEKGQGVSTGVGRTTSSAVLHGIAFPFDDACTKKVAQFIDGEINYLQLAIEIDKEYIYYSDEGNISASEISSKIPTDIPRFHFFRWEHEFQGETIESFVYVFSCPDGSNGTKSSPVKQRMLYSSSKANVADVLESKQITVAKKLEINSPSEISEEILFRELHPEEEVKKQAFARPSRPGKGARRLVRDTTPK
eukprot:TRINITY_DN2122_c0_g1_i1.p1 TRINITY_DN2122_c0_g1~~TRINITY_DN2122_c0_g1_i1.p1  ORF type:complete len:368 (-),score=114.75 TRINITY_DN2122_c0_g1_i1:155-1201(-)